MACREKTGEEKKAIWFCGKDRGKKGRTRGGCRAYKGAVVEKTITNKLGCAVGTNHTKPLPAFAILLRSELKGRPQNRRIKKKAKEVLRKVHRRGEN